jgi:hypothetical protein
MGVGSDGVAVIVNNVKRFSLAQDDTHFVCVGTPGKQPFLFLLCCFKSFGMFFVPLYNRLPDETVVDRSKCRLCILHSFMPFMIEENENPIVFVESTERDAIISFHFKT